MRTTRVTTLRPTAEPSELESARSALRLCVAALLDEQHRAPDVDVLRSLSEAIVHIEAAASGPPLELQGEAEDRLHRLYSAIDVATCVRTLFESAKRPRSRLTVDPRAGALEVALGLLSAQP